MKSILATAAAVLVTATSAFAEPVLGTWQTARDDNGNFGHIEVKECGATICGTLIRSYNNENQQIKSDNIGRQIIWDMQAMGAGKYGKGKVYAPDRDKTYSSKMELSGDMLQVKGCILGICRDGGTWRRVK
ncbi:MAG: DUF2147 domain-containing protein [Rhodobacteraceae bacterium]|nr:DUF2147 domain-containing protein [Paracoccaceae bacterium]